MKMVVLAKSGLKVTKIGFGGIPIQRLTEEEAVRVVRRAIDRGINWIDTANSYGKSEEIVGRAVNKYDRENIYIFTKGNAREPDKIREQIDLSLKRLGTNYIDLYQFHLVPSPEIWLSMQEKGTVDTVLRFKQEGIIRHIGASAHTIEAALALAQYPLIEVVQFPFNFIMKKDSLKVLNRCRKNKVGFIAMKPFGGGMFQKASPCVRFLLQYPQAAADPGFERVEEVDEVISLAEEQAPLSEEDRADIARLKRELGKSFCRRCGYCMPCEHGVSIITLMTMESLIRRFSRQQILAGWIAEAVKSLGNCVECGVCESKCPYDLPIREKIRAGGESFRKLESQY